MLGQVYSNLQDLENSITPVIKNNEYHEITGDKLQRVLLDMCDSLWRDSSSSQGVTLEQVWNSLEYNNDSFAGKKIDINHIPINDLSNTFITTGDLTGQIRNVLQTDGYETLNAVLKSINSASIGAPPSGQSGKTLVWNGSSWEYGTAGGGTPQLNNVLTSINNQTGIGIPSDTTKSFVLAYIPTGVNTGSWSFKEYQTGTATQGITLDEMWSALGTNATEQIISVSHLPSPLGGIVNASNVPSTYGDGYVLVRTGANSWEYKQYSGGGSPGTGYVTITGDETITGCKTFTNANGAIFTNKITIGDCVIEWDSLQNGLRFSTGLYSYSYITALGSGGPTLDLGGYPIVITNPSTDQVLKFNGSAWVNGTGGGGGGGTGDVTWQDLKDGTYATAYPINFNYITGALTHYTWWGQTMDAANQTVNGTINISTPVASSGDDSHKFKISMDGNNALEYNANGSGQLALGYGFKTNCPVTIFGNEVIFNPTEQTTPIARVIYKSATLSGIQIGDGLLSWDSDNNAIKVSKVVGSSPSAANFYATGGVSALGMSPGVTAVEAMQFGYLTAQNQLAFVSDTTKLTVSDTSVNGSSYVMFSVENGSTQKLWMQLRNTGISGYDASGTSDAVWKISVGGEGMFQSVRFKNNNGPYLYINGSNQLVYNNGSDHILA